MNTKYIPVDTWYALTREGMDIPVTIPLCGSSMYPLVRRLRDCVTIQRCTRELLPGDVVLFRRSDGQFVVHRVWKLDKNRVLTLGDNCMQPDGWLEKSAVLGIVTHVHRGSHTFCIDGPFWRLIGRVWSSTRKPRNALRRVLRAVKRPIRAVFRR